MRVLLPLACVALLVAASGAFADLTPLPESEWGSVVGSQTMRNARCDGEPCDPPAVCQLSEGDCTTTAPTTGLPPAPIGESWQSYKIGDADGYLVCAERSTTRKCTTIVTYCAKTAYVYTNATCAGAGTACTTGKHQVDGCSVSAG